MVFQRQIRHMRGLRSKASTQPVVLSSLRIASHLLPRISLKQLRQKTANGNSPAANSGAFELRARRPVPSAAIRTMLWRRAAKRVMFEPTTPIDLLYERPPVTGHQERNFGGSTGLRARESIRPAWAVAAPGHAGTRRNVSTALRALTFAAMKQHFGTTQEDT